jgi:hypothetical protein
MENYVTSATSLPFEIFIEDDRYSVPTLKLVSAADEMEALRLAESLLAASEHHLGVELCRDGRRLTGLGSYARESHERSPSSRSSNPG